MSCGKNLCKRLNMLCNFQDLEDEDESTTEDDLLSEEVQFAKLEHSFRVVGFLMQS